MLELVLEYKNYLTIPILDHYNQPTKKVCHISYYACILYIVSYLSRIDEVVLRIFLYNNGIPTLLSYKHIKGPYRQKSTMSCAIYHNLNVP